MAVCRLSLLLRSPEDVSLNRGNDLLLALLQHRYPKVMTEEIRRAVREWLAASTPIQEASVFSHFAVEEDWCLSVLQSYKSENEGAFPRTVGEEMSSEGRQQLALYLAQKHLKSFEATHCTPFAARRLLCPQPPFIPLGLFFLMNGSPPLGSDGALND
ncbi:phosphatidylserine lipase ABHD16A-like [Discoglossus pictus]